MKTDRILERLSVAVVALDSPLLRQAEAKIIELRNERDRMKQALDALYNHNEATRVAVVQHYGIRHASVEDGS